MQNLKIHTIDLCFQGIEQTIGAFLIKHDNGGALVECGPSSTLPKLIEGLRTHNLQTEDITDVFLTHIHLDHAGSAGWWAKKGATIHVHEVGAPHLLNPERLLASAGRIYGDMMEPLWGEFLPVPERKLNPLSDMNEIHLDGKHIIALDTPGHANHHLSYFMDGVCFTGDVGGVHMQGIPFLRLPTVPPEFNPHKWRDSIHKFKRLEIRAFCTTHFGIHKDADWHLTALEGALNEVEAWMEKVMPSEPTKESLREKYDDWMKAQSIQADLSEGQIRRYEMAISTEMSADGIYRYWNKVRDS